MSRSYYSDALSNFLTQSNESILGTLAANNQFVLDDYQRNSWMSEIIILKEEFKGFFEDHVLFEYTIPRIGKRIDNVFLYRGFVFLFEFKIGEDTYRHQFIEQVLDYALDLKYFHKESHTRMIVPVLVATKGEAVKNTITRHNDGVYQPFTCNSKGIRIIVDNICGNHTDKPLCYTDWENSIYMPTPTIIEAAQMLYRRHNVRDISRSDSGASNLTLTTESINTIIDNAKQNNEKCICFITGVPGAGKTLAGINIANERHNFAEDEHAVFLSGNGPLVDVLQEALARDQTINSSGQIKKSQAMIKTRAFIQNIHHFRDDMLSVNTAPIEKVVIFDEAQRAWTLEKTESFMLKKKGKSDFGMSEPEFLISVMDRHIGWAVIICLIGGGQEINVGEAGLPEWFTALRRRFKHWIVYLSDKMTDLEYTRGSDLEEMLSGLKYIICKELHLAVSLRSFRSERVAEFVKAVLDCDKYKAKSLYQLIKNNYPIALSRNISASKKWLVKHARGSERYGMLASSGAHRLKAFGIWTQSKVEAIYWFLNPKEDIRSSFYLEDTATEFDIQGLELDFTLVAWDADLRFIDNEWRFFKFTGTKWQNVNKDENALYLKNAYRVLLTRARQGMVIFVPEGDDEDHTRQKQYYDGTYNYFKELGVECLDNL